MTRLCSDTEEARPTRFRNIVVLYPQLTSLMYLCQNVAAPVPVDSPFRLNRPADTLSVLYMSATRSCSLSSCSDSHGLSRYSPLIGRWMKVSLVVCGCGFIMHKRCLSLFRRMFSDSMFCSLRSPNFSFDSLCGAVLSASSWLDLSFRMIHGPHEPVSGIDALCTPDTIDCCRTSAELHRIIVRCVPLVRLPWPASNPSVESCWLCIARSGSSSFLSSILADHQEFRGFCALNDRPCRGLSPGFFFLLGSRVPHRLSIPQRFEYPSLYLQSIRLGAFVDQKLTGRVSSSSSPKLSTCKSPHSSVLRAYLTVHVS